MKMLLSRKTYLERLDSGIFFNDNGMTTSIVLANYNPLFRDTDES